MMAGRLLTALVVAVASTLVVLLIIRIGEAVR